MPWLLTTPLQVGDLATDGPYTHANIVDGPFHRQDRKLITGDILYGTMSGPDFVPGNSSPSALAPGFSIEAADYDALVTTHQTLDGELTYDAVKRGLYEWLSDPVRSIIPPGTVV